MRMPASLPPDALETRHGRVGEVGCPLVNPSVLMGCKEACLQQETEPALRDIQAQDLARLRLILRKS